ncbi:hypothetical protein ACFSB1_10740 [Halopseudomonas phragmitis]|uniref:Uncharacterized protein n=1 Tax=Halopseudomonas phragmitis TaxID=1931241 RepID=A0A1V0B9J5_9GAMM|nr:hypothetical protein [Halopseudomonas phragmitis]AQZ96561.1 hypothetical protein BVH74_18185 [Halopseudomonas phragmitis]
MAAKKVKCLVLLDEPAHGLKCGQVVELDAALAQQLEAAKRVDTSAAALKAAIAAQPLQIVDSVIEDDGNQQPAGGQQPGE